MMDASRTPAAWAKECLGVLGQLNGDYRRNKAITGRFLEFVRPVEGGLFVSQNFIRVRETYYLSYALLFATDKPGRFLSSPLHAGSRFDHNYTVHEQFSRDLGLQPGTPAFPPGLWSSGKWRSNTMDNLARGFALNDQHLFPAYRQMLHEGKGRLLELFEEAARVIPRLEPGAPIADQAPRFGVDASQLESYPLKSALVSALTLARGGDCWRGFGPRTDTVDLDRISPTLTVLHYAQSFILVRERLPDLCSVIRNL